MYAIKLRAVCDSDDSACQSTSMRIQDGNTQLQGNITTPVNVQNSKVTIFADKLSNGTNASYYELSINNVVSIINTPFYEFEGDPSIVYAIKLRAVCDATDLIDTGTCINVLGRAGETFIYNINSSNYDCCHINYQAENLPEGLFIENDTGIIKGSPEEEGLFRVKITATNSIGSIYRFLYLKILPGIINITNIYLSQNEKFNYKINTTSSPISYKANNLPSGLSFDDKLGIINGTADYSYNNKNFTITAYFEDQLVQTKKFIFKVRNSYYHRRYKLYLISIGAYHDNYQYYLPKTILSPHIISPEFSFPISSSSSTSGVSASSSRSSSP